MPTTAAQLARRIALAAACAQAQRSTLDARDAAGRLADVARAEGHRLNVARRIAAAKQGR